MYVGYLKISAIARGEVVRPFLYLSEQRRDGSEGLSYAFFPFAFNVGEMESG